MGSKYKRYIIAFFATLFMILIIDNSRIFTKQSNALSLFDFSDKQESKGFYTDLDGQWYFFDQELLTPDEVKELVNSGEASIVSLPNSFENQTGNINSFGTYSTTIKYLITT